MIFSSQNVTLLLILLLIFIKKCIFCAFFSKKNFWSLRDHVKNIIYQLFKFSHAHKILQNINIYQLFMLTNYFHIGGTKSKQSHLLFVRKEKNHFKNCKNPSKLLIFMIKIEKISWLTPGISKNDNY